MTETANKKKAGGGLPPTTGRENQLSAGLSHNATASVARADRRRWESFDVWLARYERATGADAWHSNIPGGPRGWR
ncbi:hypothetical protein GCM10009804_02980 [Kribbella hippodromi]|uniref:Uncharacterized protein n=1 Tax=Kribbella hippodromi TaxID=434347 RepID=A0ABP4MSY8_9ACTN